MWLFVLGETACYGALLAGHTFYRRAAALGDSAMGGSAALCVFLLVTGSFCVAIAAASRDRGLSCLAAAGAVFLGVLFLVLMAGDQWARLEEQLTLGPWYARPDPPSSAEMLVIFQLALSAVYAVHVAVGAAALGWIAIEGLLDRPIAGRMLRRVALYWHWVVAVGVLIFPVISSVRV